MYKKPFLYAFGAALYIIIIVFVITTVTSILPVKTLFIPIAMLGLFVLSTAVMGFLFLSQPFKLYMENRKDEALTFFVRIVEFFACFVILFLVLVFLI